MATWSAKRDPMPDKKDLQKFKDFLRHKYVEKRFTADTKADDDDSSDEDEAARKARKAAKKEKRKQKKKQVSSSDDSEEIVVPAKPVASKQSTRKLGAPPGFKPTTQSAPIQDQQPKVE